MKLNHFLVSFLLYLYVHLKCLYNFIILDINGAVDAIVEVHGKGGLALKVDLLKEWIQPSSLGSNGSPSKTLIMSTNNTFYDAQENLTISEGVLR